MGRGIKKSIGDTGEDFAQEFLLKAGYYIIERNYRYSRSEIDLIVKKENTLVFVEVKTRKNSEFGFPEEFVSEAQINNILKAADHYLVEKEYSGLVRFDILALIKTGTSFEVEHFEDAFS